MDKHTYRVRPGRRFGFGKKYGPGDTVELTEYEASGFLDMLQRVETPVVAAPELVAAPEPEKSKSKGKS